MPTTQPTTKKTKQADLDIAGPGVSKVTINEIEEAADAYVDIRDKRVRMTGKEVAAKADLIEALHRNADKIGRNPDGVLRYEHDGRVILLEPSGEKLSVKNLKESEDE